MFKKQQETNNLTTKVKTTDLSNQFSLTNQNQVPNNSLKLYPCVPEIIFYLSIQVKLFKPLEDGKEYTAQQCLNSKTVKE